MSDEIINDPEPQSILSYINMGRIIYKLQYIREGAPLVTKDPPDGVLQHLVYVCDVVDELESSNRQLSNLVSEINSVKRQLQKKFDSGTNHLNNLYARRVCGVFDNLWVIVRKESPAQQFYAIKSVEEFDASNLIHKPGQVFNLPVTIEPELPKSVYIDLKEAGRCLTVGFTRAAILHTILATEAVLKYFYQLMMVDVLQNDDVEEQKRERIRSDIVDEKITWGGITNQLNQYQEVIGIRNPDLLHDAKSIKDKYRNKAMHATLEFEEGLEVAVWRECGDLVWTLLDELNSHNKCDMQLWDLD